MACSTNVDDVCRAAVRRGAASSASSVASAGLMIACLLGGCLAEEEMLEPQILELDVRTEHRDDREAWWMIARLEILGATPADAPDTVMAQLLFPSGRRHPILSQDYDAESERFEVELSFVTSAQPPAGRYTALVPAREAGGRSLAESTVDDTVEARYLDVPTLVRPVNHERIGCEPRLRWLSVERAHHYQVLLRRHPGHETVLSETLEATELQVPPGLLETGGDYEWKVFAFDRSDSGDVDNQSKSRFLRFVVVDRCG